MPLYINCDPACSANSLSLPINLTILQLIITTIDNTLNHYHSIPSSLQIKPIQQQHHMMKQTRSQSIDPTRTSFLDLPPELRNQIYGHALTSVHPLRVSESAILSSCRRQQSFPEIRSCSLCGSTKRSQHISAAILVTCRQIQSEATAILYGTNTIQLSADAPDLYRFIRSIRSSASLTQRVRLTNYSAPFWGLPQQRYFHLLNRLEMITELWKMTSLQYLELPIEPDWFHPAAAADFVKSLLVCLIQKGRTMESVLEAIHFRWRYGECYRYNSRDTPGAWNAYGNAIIPTFCMERGGETFTIMVRAELRQRLGARC